MRGSPRWLRWLVPPATILVTLVGAVLLLMTPFFMHPALSASAVFPGASAAEWLSVSDRTVGELLFGPGTFDLQRPCEDVASCAISQGVYTAAEAAHLRDARAVLYVFLGLAAASLALLVFAVRRHGSDAVFWRSVARGGAALVVGVIVLGLFAVIAFDAAFELFHRIFFPGGNWEFPADSNMIRLYPYAFWQLTSVALGVLLVTGGTAAWFLGRRRPAGLEAARS